ncbi:uncharacterized protein FFM5_05577 [Fusarium fujikuroi]|nr:uncharacterized protein FFM5_05577 [Fusarium fujikuroi]
MSCPLVTVVLIQVFLVEYEVHLQRRQYWHRSTIPFHDIFSFITPLRPGVPLPLNLDALPEEP